MKFGLVETDALALKLFAVDALGKVLDIALRHSCLREVRSPGVHALYDGGNLARGLLVLQSAGLVKLKDGGTIFATTDDIDEANSKVKVTTVDASLTASSLPDVAGAIINNDYVANAGLAASDAIAQDDPSDPTGLPYVNIFAASAADQNDPTLLKLVDIYQNTQVVLDGVSEKSGGTAVFVKTPVTDLQKSLTDVEAQVKAHKAS